MILFSECFSPKKIYNQFWCQPTFFRRKVTYFIGRENKTHILPTKIDEKQISHRSASLTIIILVEDLTTRATTTSNDNDNDNKWPHQQQQKSGRARHDVNPCRLRRSRLDEHGH